MSVFFNNTCACASALAVLQNVIAATELHRGGVCHRQKRQCAHFHWREHERQRAARAPQRYENWQRCCFLRFSLVLKCCSLNVALTTDSILMFPWKLQVTLNLRMANRPITAYYKPREKERLSGLFFL